MEAIKACLASATDAIPQGAQLVGIKVAFAYQRRDEEGELDELEACGSTISKALINPTLVAKLFAAHAQQAYETVLATPHPDHQATVLRGPGLTVRKPRRAR